MSQLVQNWDGEERAGTFLISQGFERRHNSILGLCRDYIQQFADLDNKDISNVFIINKIPAKTAGRPVEEYMLNEAQTLFLGSLFRTTHKQPDDPVLKFKVKLAKSFVDLKRQNEKLKERLKEPTRQLARAKGILIRNQETDVIEEFVEYAKNQGSTKADWYFKNITSMMNGILFIVEGKYKNLRLVMSTEQLMTVSSVERIIKKTLVDNMANNMWYKEIYKKVKKNVYTFADLHGKMEIIDKQLTLDGF